MIVHKDTDKFWNTNDPDFTPCFEGTVLLWSACGFLWLTAFFDSYFKTGKLLGTAELDIPTWKPGWTKLGILKLFIITALIAFEIAVFCINWLGPNNTNIFSVRAVLWTVPLILITTHLLSAALIVQHKSNCVHTSGIQLIHWSLLSLVHLVIFRTKLNENLEKEKPILFLLGISTFLMIVQSICFCWSDIPEYNEVKKKHEDKIVSNNHFQKNEIKAYISKYDSTKFFILQQKPECPMARSSCLSYVLFSWSTPFVRKGHKSPLRKEDLWPVQPSFKAIPVMKMFDEKFGKREFGEVRGVFSNIIKPIWKTCGFSFAIAVTCRLCSGLLCFCSPHLIEFVEIQTIEVWKGWMWAVLLFGNYIIISLFLEQFYLHIFRCYANVMICLNLKIYRKASCISYEARKDTTTGEIVNLMSVDVEKICELIYSADSIWTTPILLTLNVYLLWRELGVAIFVGVAVVIAIIPINWILTAFSANYQRMQMKKKDDRIKIINEVLSGIQIIKLYAWENSFKAQVQKIRSEEIKLLTKRAFVHCFTAALFNAVPFLVSLAGFLTYVHLSDDNVLDPKKAFTSMSLFSLLTEPITEFPTFLSAAVDATISFKRINKFLNAEEINPHATKFEQKQEGLPAIEIKNGNFSWESDDLCLADINLSIQPGTLTAVVGSVASGKSSLLSAILGDMKYSGECIVRGSIAYVPQIAWILNGTLRENICFGLTYDKVKYNNVIQACSLSPDVEMLPAGDMTEIGEKGINLSGGQRQRVSLARAAYSGADVYLFDDCLSAVDAHVGKYIFDQLIGPDGLLANKTRILCTHAHNFLSQVNYIVVMNEGRILETGSFEELKNGGGNFSTFLTKDAQSKRGSEGECIQPEAKLESRKGDEKEMADGKLIVEEHLETGDVKLDVYKTYIRAMGTYLAGAIVLFFAASQGMELGRNIVLTKWTNTSRGSKSTFHNHIFQYTVLGAGQSFTYLLGYFILAIAAMRASKTLHNTMLSRILRAPMSFYNITLLGRIVNRFSSDVESIDKLIPSYIGDWICHVFHLSGIFIAISYANMYFIPFIIPVAVIFTVLQRYYISCMQQLQRIVSSLKSPIYAQFSETLNGTATIRAYRSQHRFVELLAGKIDDYNSAMFPHLIVRRWLSIRLGFVGSTIVFIPAVFAVLWRSTTDPSYVGFSITYALSFTDILSWMIKVTSYLQYNFVSVERISEYSSVEQEAELQTVSKTVDPTWPKEGAIEFNNYETCYRSGLDPVLKHLSCKIFPGEKIGICGRTGAGKSSLTLALFRIIEATRGEIFIDNVNIASLGLHDVRKRLTVIPQDPVLFSRPLRLNLDPFEEYKDDQLWQALELAHLKTYFESLPDGLDHPISEGGENLRINDELIQETIRSTFKGCTILNVAHRLNTVLDSSRIMVLERGEIIEFDTPTALLSNPNSHFYGMAKDAGIV
ncbi:Multidrug resistance-associated protein 1 [Orchesella cincta]|uniref:Multidrug resistance-associated protein 1 n=1 Tax=Orchesella cincta TaxID=48709 RepID=A0A1D2N857_ORCCI|nr:Multidrug resistance-associated protein 1 [Orchesella cincta]